MSLLPSHIITLDFVTESKPHVKADQKKADLCRCVFSLNPLVAAVGYHSGVCAGFAGRSHVLRHIWQFACHLWSSEPLTAQRSPSCVAPRLGNFERCFSSIFLLLIHMLRCYGCDKSLVNDGVESEALLEPLFTRLRENRVKYNVWTWSTLIVCLL